MKKKLTKNCQRFTSLVVVGSMLLTGCALLPTPASQLSTLHNPHHPTTKTTIEQLRAWHLDAAIGVRTSQDNWSARLSWDQNANRDYHIRLSAPLAAHTVKLERTRNTVSLRSSKHPTPVIATSARHLLMQQTGADIPVDNLYYWIRGIAAPGLDAERKIDAGTQVVRLTQGAWTIRYERFTSVSNLLLPSKLRITGPGISLKVVIKHWRL